MIKSATTLAVLVTALTLSLAACGSSTQKAAQPLHTASPSAASIAARLSCQLNGPETVGEQDVYDTVVYDSLSAPGDPSLPCSVGSGNPSDVITFSSQAKETDWLHQNDLANSGTLADGYVGLVVGNLWVVTSGSGVVGLDDIAKALSPIGGREDTSF